MNPILLHINYFEPDLSLREACRIASELQADGLEFRRQRNTPQSDEDYLNELSLALEKHSFKAISFGTPGIDLTSPNPAQREAQLAKAIAFYREAANRFPLAPINLQTGPLLNPAPGAPGAAYSLHGSAAAQEWHWQAAIEGLKQLAIAAEELRLTFALETHPCYLHDTIEATLRLVTAVNHPAIGTLWDHTNLHIFDEPGPTLPDALEQLRPTLHSVHLKNFLTPPHKGDFIISALSDGIVNIREQLQLLKSTNYTGPLCIESPRLGDRQWFAPKDIEYLKTLL